MVDGLTEEKQQYDDGGCSLSTLQTHQGFPLNYYHNLMLLLLLFSKLNHV